MTPTFLVETNQSGARLAGKYVVAGNSLCRLVVPASLRMLKKSNSPNDWELGSTSRGEHCDCIVHFQDAR